MRLSSADIQRCFEENEFRFKPGTKPAGRAKVAEYTNAHGTTVYWMLGSRTEGAPLPESVAHIRLAVHPDLVGRLRSLGTSDVEVDRISKNSNLRAFSVVAPNAETSPSGQMLTIRSIEALRAVLERITQPGIITPRRSKNSGWAPAEVAAVVDDYFEMLVLELNGQAYNKAARARALMSALDGRTKGAIEMKRQNISAVLMQLRAPWILGYKPLDQFQHALVDAVADRLATHVGFSESAEYAVERPAAVPSAPSFQLEVVEAPAVSDVREPDEPAYSRHVVRRDYLALEALNRSLGRAGELLIVDFERTRLRRLGKSKLSERVEHVSETRGDGLGYDILSFEPSGAERLIEVKTTSFGREAPFFVTRNELALSREQPKLFKLCRVFHFRREPQMFQIHGALDQRCRLDPVSYRASFV